MNLKHRGPDNSYFETYGNVLAGFHRLAIISDKFKSNQPFLIEDNNRTIISLCNGEIYNFKDLENQFHLTLSNDSDCMTIPELYYLFTNNSNNGFESFIELFKNTIKGEFAFTIFEFDKQKKLKYIIAGRDQIGIRPLYYSSDDSLKNGLLFTSELKGGYFYNGEISEFPPGFIYKYSFNNFEEITINKINFRTVYYDKPRIFTENYDEYAIQQYYLKNVKESVISSIQRRLVADKPIAFLLSGGVDSSLVAAVAARLLGKPIRTFCCGMSEGTDLKYARMVSNYIGSYHTEVFFTPEQGLDAIRDVIKTTETWDTTTIRASVGQYLVSKYISENTECKVVLVGEGPDEVCSSYLFNWYAPDGDSLHSSALEYVKNIHMYDGRRADRCISRWGLEARVPLLDPEFISAYWNIPAELRLPKNRGIEKWWLRKAFEEACILPREVLWRKKEAFSDGVSSSEKSWFQIIQEWIEPQVSDEEFKSASSKYPFMTPQTKEAYFYRKLFVEFFGEKRLTIIPGFWQPKWNKDGQEIKTYIYPSARVLSIYSQNE
jgi:asparagine synthase (glutamine-hydrolysing)